MRKIILDTDPGRDDAVAILLALASPELEIAGIVAVAGNVPLHHTERNARRIVELTGRTDVPVYAGCARPMVRNLVTAEHIHGRTGLDGYEIPDPKRPLAPGHGVDFIVDTINSSPAGSVTLCTLGPLTNVAMALVKAPEITERIREIVLMGGAYGEVGNITPAAEFNVFADPDAADVVFKSGIPLTQASLDLTYKVVGTRDRLDMFASIGNRTGTIVAGLGNFLERFDLPRYGGIGAPLHDPCVIAYLLEPHIFVGKHINVAIETSSPLTMGMTVADWWGVTDRPPNVNFLRDVDADAFFELLRARLATLP